VRRLCSAPTERSGDGALECGDLSPLSMSRLVVTSAGDQSPAYQSADKSAHCYVNVNDLDALST